MKIEVKEPEIPTVATEKLQSLIGAGWISVKKKLPEDCGYFLGVVENVHEKDELRGDKGKKYYTREIVFWNDLSERWQGKVKHDYITVVLWAVVPEIPKKFWPKRKWKGK